MGKEQKPTQLKSAPPELQAKIRAELNEEESGRERDIGHIRAWLAQQPHLPRIDDNFILAFLRGCKFSLEKAKRKLDMYFTMRGAAPELYVGRDVTRPDMKETLEQQSVQVLPDVTPDGDRVLLQWTLVQDARTPSFPAVLRAYSMAHDILLCEERGPTAGCVFVMDAGFVSPAYFSQWTPVRVRKLVTYLQESLPMRVRQIHVINAHPLVDTLLSFVKPFMSEKLRQRVQIHTRSLDGLYEYVPRKMLPQELGGSAGPVRDMHDAWLEKLRQYGDWFRQQEQVKADESLRPGKPRNYGEMFGVEGSFRKLELD